MRLLRLQSSHSTAALHPAAQVRNPLRTAATHGTVSAAPTARLLRRSSDHHHGSRYELNSHSVKADLWKAL
jgi:hypothetical protein